MGSETLHKQHLNDFKAPELASFTRQPVLFRRETKIYRPWPQTNNSRWPRMPKPVTPIAQPDDLQGPSIVLMMSM